MREKFLKHNIPYDALDKEMIEIIDVLNFHLGLKTQFCCYGHDNKTQTYVIFDKCVTDEQIYSLAEKVAKDWMSGISFNKWVRGINWGFGDEIASNWILKSNRLYPNPNDLRKKQHLDEIVESLRNAKCEAKS